jgi:hypothetical protein
MIDGAPVRSGSREHSRYQSFQRGSIVTVEVPHGATCNGGPCFQKRPNPIPALARKANWAAASIFTHNPLQQAISAQTIDLLNRCRMTHSNCSGKRLNWNGSIVPNENQSTCICEDMSGFALRCFTQSIMEMQRHGH